MGQSQARVHHQSKLDQSSMVRAPNSRCTGSFVTAPAHGTHDTVPGPITEPNTNRPGSFGGLGNRQNGNFLGSSAYRVLRFCCQASCPPHRTCIPPLQVYPDDPPPAHATDVVTLSIAFCIVPPQILSATSVSFATRDTRFYGGQTLSLAENTMKQQISYPQPQPAVRPDSGVLCAS